jgi:hypothetical protein
MAAGVRVLGGFLVLVLAVAAAQALQSGKQNPDQYGDL